MKKPRIIPDPPKGQMPPPAAMKGKAPVRRKDEQSRVMDAMWSPEEDAPLLRAVNAFGSGNWELIGDVVTALNTARYRSARACYERCLNVLLVHDEGAREAGSLVNQIAKPGIPSEPAGSLSSLPDYALCPSTNPSLAAAMQPNAVGDAMRAQEAARANATHAASLQAEVSGQVHLQSIHAYRRGREGRPSRQGCRGARAQAASASLARQGRAHRPRLGRCCGGDGAGQRSSPRRPRHPLPPQRSPRRRARHRGRRPHRDRATAAPAAAVPASADVAMPDAPPVNGAAAPAAPHQRRPRQRRPPPVPA